MVLYKIPIWLFMTYQNLLPFKQNAKNHSLSERDLSSITGLSRTCIRDVLSKLETTSISSINKVAESLGMDITILPSFNSINSEFSVIATAYKIIIDGEDSWKIHIFDLVDEFRRTLDPNLILLPPPHNLNKRLFALLAAVVWELCTEIHLTKPHWVKKEYFLDDPWFPANINNLKASAILESPLGFRRHNIFVLDNFLSRA